MNRAEELRAEAISYLLTRYPVNGKPQYLKEVISYYLLSKFNADYVERFWTDHGENLCNDLIEETNRRVETGASIRYEILDDIGERIRGAGIARRKDPRTAFQDALQELDPLQFERLAGVLLQWAGCHSTWLTPESHDQGLDAFGYCRFLLGPKKWRFGQPEVVFLAQAKHYLKNRVSSYDVREFIGAAECAKHKVYAVEGGRYPELEVRPLAPIALIFLTSGELKVTAKILAQRSGMIVIASDELFHLCQHYWEKQGLAFPRNKHGYLSRLRKEGLTLPVAR